MNTYINYNDYPGTMNVLLFCFVWPQFMADCSGLVTFESGLVNSVLKMPNRQVKFFGVIQIIEEL